MVFADRADAGRRLAAALSDFTGGDDLVVAALVRGGVPVAAEVATHLGAPLEALVIRKVGAPGNPEYGIGAVGEDGHVLRNHQAIAATGVSAEEFAARVNTEAIEVARRVALYRGPRARHSFEGKTVIVVDDGLATGVTARAGVEASRHFGAERVVLAVPVGAVETVRALEQVADAVVCLETPPDFRAVGSWYADFRQVSDDEVIALLAPSPRAAPPQPPA